MVSRFTTPVLDAVLAGPAWVMAQSYSLLQYVKLQTRISTATDRFLDFISRDFFGTRLGRRVAENDTSFRARIKKEILRPRATRAALTLALVDLTAKAPAIFEPTNPYDAGGYGRSGMTVGTGLGYGLAGGYGSLQLPFQVFVGAYRPSTNGGIASVAGYYTPTYTSNLIAGSSTFSAIVAAGDATMTVSSTDVPIILPGYSVAKHASGPTSTNVGFVSIPATPGVQYAMSMWLYIPSNSTATNVVLDAEGSGDPTRTLLADMSIRNGWQRILSSDATTSGTSTFMVLRVNGPSGAVVYSSGWSAGQLVGTAGGYGAGSIEYGSLTQITGVVTDADINATIAKTMPDSTIAWSHIIPS